MLNACRRIHSRDQVKLRGIEIGRKRKRRRGIGRGRGQILPVEADC